MNESAQSSVSTSRTPNLPLKYEYETGKFWTHWIVGSLLVWPVSIVVAAVIFVPFAFVFGSLLQIRLFDYSNDLSDIVMGGLMTTIAGGAIGFSVGTIQQYVFKNILYWTADRWRLASTLGGIAGGLLVGLIIYITDPYYYDVNESMTFIAMPIYITTLSLVQYFAMRVAVRAGWMWVLANLIGGVVFSGLLMRNSLDASMWGELIATIGLWVLATVAQGAVTGYVLLFLFERMAYPYEDEEKIDTRTPINNEVTKARSIWDEAV